MEPTLLIALIVKYGPAVINEVVQAWKEAGEPSQKEIEELAGRCPPPTDYFPDAGIPDKGGGII